MTCLQASPASWPLPYPFQFLLQMSMSAEIKACILTDTHTHTQDLECFVCSIIRYALARNCSLRENLTHITHFPMEPIYALGPFCVPYTWLEIRGHS